MTNPDAVKKHDGRLVAFDSAKLAASISRAAQAANRSMSLDSAQRLGTEIAQAVGSFLVSEGPSVPSSADVRTFVLKLLRETGNTPIAESYAEHSRAASSLLWRIRVADPALLAAGSNGQPWDRRRLLESFRAAGIARDPAGEAAREVERRLVALGQERVSPALIHALSSLVLSSRAFDTRSYGARRLAFSLAAHVPHFDPLIAEHLSLPREGPALEAFWLQAVHSAEIARLARENILGLEPYPSSPGDDPESAAPCDPLQPEMPARLREWSNGTRPPLYVRADTPERVVEFSRLVALLPASLIPQSSAIVLSLSVPERKSARRAYPVTINAAGLFVREALRDQERATVRLARAVFQAAHAHREREEYFNYSPVRGRQLPIAVAGLWNAVAWLQGGTFDAPQVTRASRALAETLASVLRGSIATLRDETGMELILTGVAPRATTASLWRRDRDFFLRDGVMLDPNSVYDAPGLSLAAGATDLGERLDFCNKSSRIFDESPSLTVKVPLGEEPDPSAWREFISAIGQSGVSRLDLLPGGGVRVLKVIGRSIRLHLEEYPLFQ
jgi:hypothetical protein